MPPPAGTPLPLLGMTLGDPAGIGPEVCLAAMRADSVRQRARVVALGPLRYRPSDVPLLADTHGTSLRSVGAVAWVDTGDEGDWVDGRPQASAGRAALAALSLGAELAHEGLVDALVTGPVSKQALHLAGERVEGQTELLGRWAEAERVQMLAVAGRLRVLLLTRHMPLRQALREITQERVLDHLRFLSSELQRFGLSSPRLALAGLNPHAGEGGLLGSEEADILKPAVVEANDEGLDVVGPASPDTVFLRASQGHYDAVLALYHDQAFLPVKIHAPNRALTAVLGLPYLRVSPAHGTAFDIAGCGVADPTNMIAALEQTAEIAAQRPMRAASARSSA